MDEERRETLWVPQREGAYKEHREILQRFSKDQVVGISLKQQWYHGKRTWGFLVDADFPLGEKEHEEALSVLVTKEDLERMKAFCGMAKASAIAECLRAAADAFRDDRLYRIEGDICSDVWHDDEKHCTRFLLAADRTGWPRLSVYISHGDLPEADREVLGQIGLDSRVTIVGRLALYGHQGAVQLRGYAVKRVDDASDYQKWCGEEEDAFRQWLAEEGRDAQRRLFHLTDVEKGKRLAEWLSTREWPCRVGLIAPEDSQGAEDFTSRLPHGKGHVIEDIEIRNVNFARVEAIEEAMAAFNAKASCDCIAIVRGGGDRYGMNVFQTAELAKAIAESPLPVVLGVGHAKDRFLCDKAAQLFGRTPTDAAAALAQAFGEAWKKKRGDVPAKKGWEAEKARYKEQIVRLMKERDESRREAAHLRQELAALQKELAILQKKPWEEEEKWRAAAAHYDDGDSGSLLSRFKGFLRRK